jgi:hypothetical protein
MGLSGKGHTTHQIEGGEVDDRAVPLVMTSVRAPFTVNWGMLL